MRTYSVRLTSKVGTMAHFPLASSYADAEDRARKWANNHPDYGKHGPWTASHAEVSA